MDNSSDQSWLRISHLNTSLCCHYPKLNVLTFSNTILANVIKESKIYILILSNTYYYFLNSCTLISPYFTSRQSLNQQTVFMKPDSTGRPRLYPIQNTCSGREFLHFVPAMVVVEKGYVSWCVGRQQGWWCQWPVYWRTPLCRRLVSVRSWLDARRGQVPLQYLNSTVSSES